MHALVLADGDRPTRAGLDAAWPGWDREARLVVAADGGARLAPELDLSIDLWVGDGDSLGSAGLAALAREGVPLERADMDKDESDTELALLAAIRLGAGRVTILGGLGGRRIDHALANVALLAHPALAGRGAQLLDDRTRISLVDATGERRGLAPVHRPLIGRAGDLVSLLPWGGAADGVTTQGLRYALDDERLEAGPARGLSNVREVERAAVSVRAGRVLVVESPARLSP